MIRRMTAASPIVPGVPFPHKLAGASVRDWVDALANGSCDSAEFLRHLRRPGRENSEEIWEALALLDQSFRSRRIDRETFLSIKISLQRFALGRDVDADVPVTVRVPAAAQPAVPSPIRIGTVLRGRYRIIGVLGRGAKGTVVEAIDELRAAAPDIMQRIAIRIFDAQQLKESGQVSAYLRHVCKLQTLSHPNLLRVFDFDQDEGRPFLTMELLSGCSLPQFVAPTDSALQYRLDLRHVLRCVAAALQCAHAQGIAHGGLRAEEIFITLTGDVRLMGLDGAFNRNAEDIAKDHLAFARLVIDLLGEGSHAGQLRQPAGLTDRQWRALEAVILGQGAEGDRLLQLFAEPDRAAAAEESYPVSSAVPPFSSSELFESSSGKAKWVWSLLLLGLAGGAGYVAYERPELLSYFTTPSDRALPAAAPPATAAAPKASAESAVQQPDQPAADVAPAIAPVANRSTINLAQAALQVEGGTALALVRVLRQGNTSRSATFVWWTENGSAEPDVDFYAVTPRGAEFPANSSSVDLYVPLIPTATHEEPVTFYVKIDEAGNGARLGGRTLAQVSIVPPGYVPAPVSEDAPD
jgi:serine/threonine protein kinase